MILQYLQHNDFETPGSILDWARECGAEVRGTMLFAGEALPDPESFDWLVVMGGPMNVYEEEKYPWLAAEKTLIRAAGERGKTVLGLCLGAQLIAAAYGGAVTRNPEPEIGWHTVRLTEEAERMPTLAGFPRELTVFQWHGDTFSALPQGATRIAAGDACYNQAFCIGARVFGFQFHLENTAQIIESLLTNCADEMTDAPYVQSPVEIASRPDCIRACNAYMKQFLDALAQS
ncbi:MAG: type 1 glutamine amidotransferase [Oscillospiraceae bacterium]